MSIANKLPALLAAGEQFWKHRRLDGWVNTLTGLGTSRDRATLTEFQTAPPLNQFQLDALFDGDDLATTIVSELPNDALREGYTVEFIGEADSKPDDVIKQARELESAMWDLKLRERLLEVCLWSRLYGGAALVLGVRGSGTHDQPLVPERTTTLEWVAVTDRYHLVPRTYYGDGRVETWHYTPVAETGEVLLQTVVHESRIIRFSGAKTPPTTRARNQGWDLSVLQKAYPTLKDFNTRWSSITHMFTDMSQVVMKVQGLIDMIGSGQEGAVQKRAAMTDLIRGVSRAILLDAGGRDMPAESYEVVERGALTGVDGITQQSFLRLATTARMPVTKLLGQSPAGLNATGENDKTLWDDQIQAYRLHEIEPRATQVLALVCHAQGKDPEMWGLVWPSLDRPDPVAESTVLVNRTNAQVALIREGVLFAEEVALQLDTAIPGTGVDPETKARRASLDLELADLEDPPPPPPQLMQPPTEGGEDDAEDPAQDEGDPEEGDPSETPGA